MHIISFTKPDDWHLHLRDNEFLTRTVADASQHFQRAIIMPNLIPAITTYNAALNYRERILSHNKTKSLTPLMTFYLSADITVEDLTKANNDNLIYACKLYPKGATTNSEAGVKNIEDCYPLLEYMQECGMPLLIHGETPSYAVDIFDREADFIQNTLTPLIKKFPKLKIVLEHISTKTAVDFIKQAPSNLAATITAHHLMLNRNDILAGGIKPHHYCLPIAKREIDRQALLEAATSGNYKFFLGTDSAPHTTQTKESPCGCAGIYTSFHAISLYLESFDKAGELDKFENFASVFGPKFYGLPINTSQVTYIKEPWLVPATLPFGDSSVVPLCAGQTLQWQPKQ